jgi:hypothetical protein
MSRSLLHTGHVLGLIPYSCPLGLASGGARWPPVEQIASPAEGVWGTANDGGERADGLIVHIPTSATGRTRTSDTRLGNRCR